jgi:hypothetical protein
MNIGKLQNLHKILAAMPTMHPGFYIPALIGLYKVNV